MICNDFLQVSQKLLNLLFYNFAGAIVMGIHNFDSKIVDETYVATTLGCEDIPWNPLHIISKQTVGFESHC